MYPDHDLLPSRWKVWKQLHPNARPPEGFAWLDDESDLRHPSLDQLREARKISMGRV
jgi:hypothetical protein